MPDTTASAELWITAISEGLGEDVGGGDRQDASRDVGDPLARCDREAQIVEPASTDHRGGAAAEVLQGSLAIDGPGPLHLAHQGRSMLTALQDHTGPLWSSRLSSSTGRIVAPRPRSISARYRSTTPSQNARKLSATRYKRRRERSGDSPTGRTRSTSRSSWSRSSVRCGSARTASLISLYLVRPVAIALRTVPGRSPASVSVARIKRPSLSNGAPGSSG